MSEFYQYGDLVTIGSEDTPIYPINSDGFVPSSIPREVCIVDCSGDEPTAYVPYRIYTGDNVIAVPTLEGYALIPDDISGDGTFEPAIPGSQSVVGGTITIKESPASSCNGLLLRRPNNTTYFFKSCYTAFQTGWNPPIPETMTIDYYYGWNVYGHGYSFKLPIVSRNAYEYIDFTVSGDFGHDINDSVGLFTSDGQYIQDMPWSWADDAETTLRIDAYPGYGNEFGESALNGGYGTVVFAMRVGSYNGKTPTYRIEYGIGFITDLIAKRSSTITLKCTGRYGNYQ